MSNGWTWLWPALLTVIKENNCGQIIKRNPPGFRIACHPIAVRLPVLLCRRLIVSTRHYFARIYFHGKARNLSNILRAYLRKHHIPLTGPDRAEVVVYEYYGPAGCILIPNPDSELMHQLTKDILSHRWVLSVNIETWYTKEKQDAKESN